MASAERLPTNHAAHAKWRPDNATDRAADARNRQSSILGSVRQAETDALEPARIRIDDGVRADRVA
jgi:hypothetical protein